MNTLSNAQLNDVSGGPIPVIVWYVGSAIAGAAAGYLAGTSQNVTVTNTNTLTCNAPAPAQQ